MRPRDKMHDIDGRLFQAAAWRRYATKDRKWADVFLRKSRAECIRQARVNVYLARRLNRRKPCTTQ